MRVRLSARIALAVAAPVAIASALLAAVFAAEGGFAPWQLLVLIATMSGVGVAVLVAVHLLLVLPLRASEASFTALFDLAPLPLAYTRETDGYGATNWNQAWYRAFGYSPENCEGHNGNTFGLWADPADRQRYIDAARRDGSVSAMEVGMRRADGKLRRIELHGRFVGTGESRLLVTAYLDVTDVRNAEAALRARELWLRSLFEVSPVAVLIVDMQGRIRECNQRFAEMTGYASGETLGRPYFDFVHPMHLEAARQGVGRMLGDSQVDVFSAERDYRRKDGTTLHGLLSARRLPASLGNEDALLVIISDLSELRAAQAQQLESEAKLREIFNASPAAMIVSDVRRNYAAVAANDAWERQFRRARSTVMGLTGAEMGLWDSTADRDAVLEVIARTGGVDGFETRLVRGDGVRLVCRISARKVLAGDAELLVMVQEDVGELRRAEAALQRLNAELERQLALTDAVARTQSNFIANAGGVEAFATALADLLQLTGSEYGFVGEVRYDENGVPYLQTCALTDIAWNDATRRLYDEQAAQGLEFRRLDSLIGAVLSSGEAVIANDPANDPRRGGLPAGHPVLDAFLGLPIRLGGRLEAMVGLANRAGGYDEALASWLNPFLATIGQMVDARRAAIAREAAETALRELNAELDNRVRARTAELHTANDELRGALDDLRRAQGDLVRSEKLAALGALVAGVAHELNTPIGNSVMVASTLVDQTVGLAQEMQSGLRRSTLTTYVAQSQEAAELLLSNLKRAANLVSSFKQVAVDQTSEQRRSFDVAEVVDEILAMLRPQLKRRPLAISVDVPAGIVLDSYPGPFGQVVANLVANAAIHAFPDEVVAGHVRISGAAGDDGGVCLTISDDGVGIAAENIGRIFDPFFTTRLGQGGSGLGLHIVYNIVTGVLGGEIRVASTPGKGCTFIVTLPAAAPQRA